MVRSLRGCDDAHAACAVEPAFVALPGATLHLSIEGAAGQAMLDYLAHRIRRRRSDLLSHARRVLLAHHLGDPTTSCAAMLDLACALEGRGQDLRRILFSEVAHGMRAEQRELLRISLERVPRYEECESVRGTLLRPPHAEAALLRNPHRPLHGH